MKKYNIFIDTETTGLRADENGITQLSILVEDVETREIVEIFDEYIRPDKSCIITRTALEIQGITEADLKTDKYKSEWTISGKFKKFFDKYKYHNLQLVGYNISFDMWFLETFLKRNFIYYNFDKYSYYDVLERVRDYELNMYNSLGNACTYFGVKLDNAHNSLADVTATRELYHKI